MQTIDLNIYKSNLPKRRNINFHKQPKGLDICQAKHEAMKDISSYTKSHNTCNYLYLESTVLEYGKYDFTYINI